MSLLAKLRYIGKRYEWFPPSLHTTPYFGTRVFLTKQKARQCPLGPVSMVLP